MKRERLCLTLLLAMMVFLMSCTSLPLSEYINPDAEWTMVIESLDDPQQSVTIKNSDATTIAEQKCNTLHYENLGGRDIDLTLAYVNSETCDGGVEILATIANNEQGWMVRSFEGPSLTGLKAGVGDAIMVPLGTGFRISIKESLSIAEKIKNGENPAKLLSKILKWAWNSES